MFELWFREMEATTDPSSPAFLRGGWRLLQLRRRRFKFPGRESVLPMRNSKLLGQGYYCSFSAKLEVVTV
ncbi:BnaCnng33230D [Brassica napus]|uniref:BnaCnng33230D protein n=1 Tax=Brassica napus TaxID=3708 RepID=A0A078J3I6_BRANA|nr:BnaCnng33230D [Brassica napus]